jgi:hypothetical protein
VQDLVEAERGVVGSDRDVGVQRDAGAEAQRVALHERDRDPGEAGQERVGLQDQTQRLLPGDVGAPLALVAAVGEVLALRPDHEDQGLGGRPLERVDPAEHGADRQAVAVLRGVQGDRRDAVLDGTADGVGVGDELRHR